MRATGLWSVVAVVMGMGMGVGGCDPGAGDGDVAGEGEGEAGGEAGGDVAGEGEGEDGGEGEGEDGCAVDADCADGEVCASYTEGTPFRFCRPPSERGERCGGFDGDGTLSVACVGDLLCELQPGSGPGEEMCVPSTNRANGEPCDTNDQCSSGDCHLGDRCIPNECERDADCEAGLVCKISSCDGAACVAPAGESEVCNAVDFRGCTVTHTCQDALTCTVDGLCD